MMNIVQRFHVFLLHTTIAYWPGGTAPSARSSESVRSCDSNREDPSPDSMNFWTQMVLTMIKIDKYIVFSQFSCFKPKKNKSLMCSDYATLEGFSAVKERF
jgi:hypothetical protein